MGAVTAETADSARAAAAQAWLAETLRPSDAAAADSVLRLHLSAGSVQAIEIARAVLTAENSISKDNACLQSHKNARVLSAAAALTAAAGGDIGPPHPLSIACATLSLGERSACDAQRLAAVSLLASQLAAADADCAKALHERAEAAQRARVAAEELRVARAARAECSQGTRARERDAMKDWEKVETMHAKGAEYEAATARFKMLVRQSGVSTDCTHESVAALAARLAMLEREVKELETTLQGYMELPADLQLARQTLEGAKEEVRAADERIQRALKGIMD